MARWTGPLWSVHDAQASPGLSRWTARPSRDLHDEAGPGSRSPPSCMPTSRNRACSPTTSTTGSWRCAAFIPWSRSSRSSMPWRGATTVGSLAHHLPPLPDRRNGERRGVVISTDIDPCLVATHVVDTVGDCLADGVTRKIMYQHFFGCGHGLPLSATILEVTDEFFLLGVDGNHWLFERYMGSGLPT